MKTQFFKWATILVALFCVTSVNAAEVVVFHTDFSDLEEMNLTSGGNVTTSADGKFGATRITIENNGAAFAYAGGATSYLIGNSTAAKITFYDILLNNGGRVVVKWGSDQSNRNMTVGYGSTEIKTESGSKGNLYVTEFIIPSGVTGATDIFFAAKQGSNTHIFEITIYTNSSGPVIEQFTIGGITVTSTAGANGSITEPNATTGKITVNNVPYATDITSATPTFMVTSGTGFKNNDQFAAKDFSSATVDYVMSMAGESDRTYTVTVNKIAPTTCNNIQINSFSVPFRGNTINGTINQSAKTINFNIPFTTTLLELQNDFSPVFAPRATDLLCTTDLESWTPAPCLLTNASVSGTVRDLSTSISNNNGSTIGDNTNPAKYIVVAQNGDECSYTVQITRLSPNTECSIDSIYFTGYNKDCYKGVISGTNIKITLPDGVSLSSLTPEIFTNSLAATPVKSITPSSTDFSVQPVEIVIVSEKAEAGIAPVGTEVLERTYYVTVENHTHKPDTIAGGARPANNATGLGLSGMAVFAFDEDITLTGTIGNNVTISGVGSPSLGTVSIVNNDEIRFTYSNLTSEEDYTITIPAGYVEDCWGNTNDKIEIKFTTGAGLLTDFPYSACMNTDEFSTPAFIQGSTVAVAYNPAADTKATTPNQYGAYEIPAGQSLTITVAEAGQIAASIYAPGGNRSFTITTGSATSTPSIASGNFSNYANKGTTLVSTPINVSTQTDIFINNTSGSGVIYVPFIYISGNGQPALSANEACCK